MTTRRRWAPTFVAVVVCCCVLSFYRVPAEAQRTPNPAKPPFASAVEQRLETINELKAIRELLKAQNQLIQDQNELLRDAFPSASRSGKK